MMSTPEEHQPVKPAKPEASEAGTNDTVRGSGFTYDERRDHTDESMPRDEAPEQDIVKLPDLGQPDRP